MRREVIIMFEVLVALGVSVVGGIIANYISKKLFK